MSSLLFRVLNILLDFMELAIFIDVILSFIPKNISNNFVEFVHVITEPLLGPGRKIQEKLIPGIMIDFSPVFALLIISLLRRILFMIL